MPVTSAGERKRTREALKKFRQAWDQSSRAFSAEFETRRDVFSLYWSYYANTTFADSAWNQYKAQNKLYRQMRSLYNPVGRLCDFYAAAVYPGPLSEDGENLPEGMPLAIPLPVDTPDNIRTALSQLWQWTNWQDGKAIYVLFGAVFGSVLLEVVDDLEHEKVAIDITKPDKVADLVLDGSGNVKAYALEYMADIPVLGTDGRVLRVETVRFRKEVDKGEFRYFKDDKAFTDYPGGAVQENPYGFVPAAWARHRNYDTDFGAPAADGIIGKIDELNSVASHTLDQVHKVIGSPVLLAGEGKISNITDLTKRTSPAMGDEDQIDRLPSDGELLLVLKANTGTTSTQLVGNLSIGDALQTMERLLQEIESDRPELTMWSKLRDMQQVSAPGAMKLMGDVTARVSASAAQYDLRYKQIEQMRMAIAGWRFNGNGWIKNTRAQQKFSDFDLDSFDAGDLDFDVLPRPLVIPTNGEKYTDLGLLMTAVSTAKTNGIPITYFFEKFLGWSPEEVSELKRKIEEEQKAVDTRATTNAVNQASASALARIGDQIPSVGQ